jgi:hypothetical protein
VANHQGWGDPKTNQTAMKKELVAKEKTGEA